MTDSSELTGAARRQRGFLGFVEKVGNILPDPIMIFVYLIAILMVLSAIGAALGWSASLNYPGDEAPEGGVLENGVLTYTAVSLFSEANITRLLTEMPRTLTGFAPLGLVLLVMFGAGVAERTGLFSALIRAMRRK
jgi:aminobenzoyl-glutamate transport protein